MTTLLNNYPLVSVVMATYNGGKYINEQLESICQQSYTNIEIVICDDCSTDNTQELIRQFQKKESRIRFYINETNLGVNKNFENAINKAKGDFIAISDQDDIWDKRKIENHLNLFVNKQTVLVHSASLLFSENKMIDLKSSAYKGSMMSGSDARRMLLRNGISGHNMMFRQNLVPHLLPIPATLYYDWWIAVVASCNGSIAKIPMILTYHRHHAGNVTEKKKPAAQQTISECQERIAALESFLQIPQLNISTKNLANQLLHEYKQLQGKRFSFKLFVLLIQNASILFYYKKKKFPYFSYLKTAYRMSHAV